VDKGSINRIGAIIQKEFKEIIRSPLYLLLAHFVPLALYLVFGFGLSLDVEHIPTAFLDLDRTQTSRQFIDGLIETKYFHLTREARNNRELVELLKKGSIRLAIIIPPQFQKRLRQDLASPVQVLVDGTYPYRGLVTKNYLTAYLASFNQGLIQKWLKKRGLTNVNLQPIKLETRFLYNESLISSFSLVPGLLVVVLMMNPATMAAIAIVREKDYGTIYNIYASPTSRWEFLTGKLIPYYFLNLANILVLSLLSITLFGVPFKGSFLLFLLGSLLYIFTTTGMGLIISAFTRSMVAAQFVTIIITIIPSFLYSGLLMPVSNLGREGEIEAHLFPAMYYMKIVQGTYSKVIGLKEMAMNYLVLLIYGVTLFLLGLTLFKKREG
jgi:ABC-2 type transport system permease protein